MTKFVFQSATGLDVPDIVSMAESHFQTEIDNIFKPEPITYSRNVTLAIVNQFYLPTTSLVSVCRDHNKKLLAYTWASSLERSPWSDDHMVNIRMAHVDLSLSARDRIKLVNIMMDIWEVFAMCSKSPIICSTTMRNDQHAFLKLHEKRGYDVRGSYAYKRINLNSP
jgi:hypothetical protein